MMTRVLALLVDENRTTDFPPRDDDHDTTTQHDDDDVAAKRSSVTLGSLDELALVEPLVSTCYKMGFHRPTPVQRQLIPLRP